VGDGVVESDSCLSFEFRWRTFDVAELEERVRAAASYLRSIEAEVVRMVANVMCRGDGYLDHEEALSRALSMLHDAGWELASLPPEVRRVIGRVGGRGACCLGIRQKLIRCCSSGCSRLLTFLNKSASHFERSNTPS
jgi:hypothetical protein